MVPGYSGPASCSLLPSLGPSGSELWTRFREAVDPPHKCPLSHLLLFSNSLFFFFFLAKAKVMWLGWSGVCTFISGSKVLFYVSLFSAGTFSESLKHRELAQKQSS